MSKTLVRRACGAVVHIMVERVLEKVGADISIARRVRRISVADFAERIGVSRATLHRLESGDPAVSLNTLAKALHAVGRLDALEAIADPANDQIAMVAMMADVPKRISKSRKQKSDDNPLIETVVDGKYVAF